MVVVLTLTLYKGSLDLTQSDRWFLGDLPDIPRVAGSKKTDGGSESLPFENDGGCCALGNL